jgi:hypothetical protein
VNDSAYKLAMLCMAIAAGVMLMLAFKHGVG